MFCCLILLLNTLLTFLQDATLAHYSGYTEEEIEPVFQLMVDYLHRPVSHEAFFKKYASKKFLKGMYLWSLLVYSSLTLFSFHPHSPVGQEVPPPVRRQFRLARQGRPVIVPFTMSCFPVPVMSAPFMTIPRLSRRPEQAN